MKEVHIIGGGLAGAEAAWQLMRAGVPVILHEMRPHRQTEAHVTGQLAELVCSNSLRSDDADYNAVGLLHEEMRRLGSLILSAADECRVPAGGALAVDRDGFAAKVESSLQAQPLFTLRREELIDLPPADWDRVIIATGPLTSAPLAQAVAMLTGESSLSFFDAIAPIVYKESIDFSKAWYQSRYDKGTGTDYINLPLSQRDYEELVDGLLTASPHLPKEWEGTPYFEGCLPVEEMARRGRQTLAFGPLKPVGLTNPHAPQERPFAVVQLRQDNALGTLYNIVGFQTKMKHAEQIKVFQRIPGLEQAQFARLGGMHRNTFINSPRLLDKTLRLRNRPNLSFAGQITGCEGYVESAAIGLLAGRFAAAERLGKDLQPPPVTTAIGALLNHITGGANSETFQPMNINFGLFPAPPDERDEKGRRIKGRERKKLYARRALADLASWSNPSPEGAPG
ncbi:MAG TPA: methylenetetrahydrofolate--tRNA-(uracil(54)-C(5))-methyltransferase (FADH(2)-oxidizing) TrmFO [Rhodospirillaceae bacterium]|nr:methylenetetrahydrofolate--tRNA-(uracil(54)-C(5))-methyltransferase (FADH(2)-oxidizing) TrmFO [Rhodospirillaceae bacterium]